MEMMKVDIDYPDTEVVQKAADVLKRGGIVVYPTDTAYGIAVNAMDEEAVKKLYDLKGRDYTKPTHVVVKDWEMIETFTNPSEDAIKIYEEFMPGPITMILNKRTYQIPDMLGSDTLGVRIPDTELTKELSNFVHFPYTTPSANRSGEKTPYSVEDVKKVLDIEKVDLVLDGGQLEKVEPSTIVDLTGDEMKILREGPITEEEIKNILGLE